MSEKISGPDRDSRRIVLAVTASQSLGLMRGLPDYLAEQGWDVDVVADQSGHWQFGRRVTFHRLQMRRDPSLGRDLFALVRWIRLIAKLVPDVVVAGTPKAGLLGMVASWILRVPRRVYWLRGLRAETETGLRRAGLLLFESIAMWTATDVLAVSHSLAEQTKSMRLVPRSRIIVLGSGSSNGVESARFDLPRGASVRAEVGLNPDLPTVGFVGRLTSDKGVDTLVDAVLKVALRVPIQLLVVGAEEGAGLRSAFERRLADAAIPCVFLGHVRDIAPIYGAMDVLCLPSKREGFPNVVLEAAAAGVPAVCSDSTGCRDAVIHEVTGLLARVGDPEDVATALTRILCESDLGSNMGQAAKKRVKAEFEREHVWQLHLDYFSHEPLQKPASRAGRTDPTPAGGTR